MGVRSSLFYIYNIKKKKKKIFSMTFIIMFHKSAKLSKHRL